MRTRLELFLVLGLASCAGAPEADPLVVHAETLRDRACACASVECASTAQSELLEAVGAADAPDGDDGVRLGAAIDAMGACMIDVALRGER